MVVDEDGGLVLQSASVHEGVPLPVALLLTRLTDVPQPFAKLLQTTRMKKFTIVSNDLQILPTPTAPVIHLYMVP